MIFKINTMFFLMARNEVNFLYLWRDKENGIAYDIFVRNLNSFLNNRTTLHQFKKLKKHNELFYNRIIKLN